MSRRGGKLEDMKRPDPKFAWFVPIDGDGEQIGTEIASRPPTFDALRAIVETAEAAGYDYLLIPTRFANGLFASEAPPLDQYVPEGA